MSGYIGNIPVPQATQTRDVFTATSGQTTFATSGYTPGFLDVWLNGVKLVNGTDFTATNGSDVVLASGAATSDIVEVLGYSTYEVNAQTYTGGLTAKNDGAAAITADRLTSAGIIVDLQKDGTTVGSIGVEGGDLTIGDAGAGLQFRGIDPCIRPHNMTTNSPSDNAVDLGRSNTRFKNLYLSGGVYLGGTGGENLLDDYEEGSFTPSLGDGTNNATLTTANGRYTKIGNQVTVHVGIYFSSKASASGDIRIYGLPFTPNSDFTGNYSHSGGAIRGYAGGLSTPHNCITGPSYLYFVASSGGGTTLGFGSLNNAGSFFGSLTYRTT